MRMYWWKLLKNITELDLRRSALEEELHVDGTQMSIGMTVLTEPEVNEIIVFTQANQIAGCNIGCTCVVSWVCTPCISGPRFAPTIITHLQTLLKVTLTCSA